MTDQHQPDTQQPTPEQIADATQAQAHVQQLLTNSQVSVLYEALVNARIEIAQLRRQLAEHQQTEQLDSSNAG